MSDEVTRLVRGGRGGETIHLRGCKRASETAVPWVWAEGRPDSEWRSIPWLKACKVCLPEKGREPHEQR